MHLFAASFVTASASLAGLLAAPLAAQLAWQDITSAGPGPGARYWHAMAFDRGRGTAVLFGGWQPFAAIYGDTWELQAGAWVLRAPSLSPPADLGGAMVYDRVRGQCVLFGGELGTSPQTWLWDGAAWTLANPPVSPPPRGHAGFVYVPRFGESLLFGGSAGTQLRNDTWSWDGSAWTMRFDDGQPGQPPARARPGMAFDEWRGRVLLCAGRGSDQPAAPFLGDTWQWDGAAWSELLPAHPLPAMMPGGMEFDGLRGRVVIYGGHEASGWVHVLREWDGGDWLDRVMPAWPPASADSVLVYDPQNLQLLMHGGSTPFSGTSLNNSQPTTWALRTTLPAAFAEYGAGCGSTFVPGLACNPVELPWVGAGAVVHVTGVPAGRNVMLAVGFDSVTSPFGSLPFPLGAFGAPGCDLLADPMWTEGLGATPARWVSSPLPPITAGLSICVQAVVFDPAANGLGAALSPGGRLTVGVR